MVSPKIVINKERKVTTTIGVLNTFRTALIFRGIYLNFAPQMRPEQTKKQKRKLLIIISFDLF